MNRTFMDAIRKIRYIRLDLLIKFIPRTKFNLVFILLNSVVMIVHSQEDADLNIRAIFSLNIPIDLQGQLAEKITTTSWNLNEDGSLGSYKNLEIIHLDSNNRKRFELIKSFRRDTLIHEWEKEYSIEPSTGLVDTIYVSVNFPFRGDAGLIKRFISLEYDTNSILREANGYFIQPRPGGRFIHYIYEVDSLGLPHTRLQIKARYDTTVVERVEYLDNMLEMVVTKNPEGRYPKSYPVLILPQYSKRKPVCGSIIYNMFGDQILDLNGGGNIKYHSHYYYDDYNNWVRVEDWDVNSTTGTSILRGIAEREIVYREKR